MINRDNYRLVHAYLAHLRTVAQLGETSVGRYKAYLAHLLVWAGDAPFARLPGISPTFAVHLAAVAPDGPTTRLAPATLRKIVQTSKRFLAWGKMHHPREFRALSAAWIDGLRPPRQVEPPAEHVYVSLDEVRRLVAAPVREADLALRRDQAAAALLFLSGMRAGALGSLPIEAVDLPNRAVKQRPSLGTRTKNAKAATTYLLPIPDLLAVVERWDGFVRARLPEGAMWYTPVRIRWGEATLSPSPAGANRNVALVKRMRKLFAAAGLAYKSPHKFRHGHAVYALQHARTMADYKAVSQNLMHADIRVTDGVYAPLLSDEVKRRIAVLGDAPSKGSPVEGGLASSLRGLSPAELAQALHVIAEQLAGWGTHAMLSFEWLLQAPVVRRARAAVRLLHVHLRRARVVLHHVQRRVAEQRLQREHVAGRAEIRDGKRVAEAVRVAVLHLRLLAQRGDQRAERVAVEGPTPRRDEQRRGGSSPSSRSAR